MLIIIAPMLGWSLPALAPIAAAAAGYLGFKKLTASGDGAWGQGELEERLRSQKIVSLPLQTEAIEPVADELGHDETLTFQKDDITLIFRKDVHGKFHVDIMGPTSRSTLELQSIGHEFAVNLIQEFAHSRLVKELDRKGITVVGEERAENGDLVIRTRKWG